MSLLTMAAHGDQSSICSLDLSVLSGQDINAPTVQPRDARFGSKLGQVGPKWDKSGAFSDQISVHLAPLHSLVETVRT